jgi:2-polyprenyl-3-methyl-5-hydroxy-6-metoxy-1,4-benzoquinol methylase
VKGIVEADAMETGALAEVEREPALRQNERNEAEAFDRLAGLRDPESLRTSEWTFSRYRSATLGGPLYAAYPDRAFVYLGRHCLERDDPERPLRGVRVLDLGAGDGIWSVILAEQGAEVTSIEISPRQVELARTRMRIHGLTWDARVGSAFDLEAQFPSGAFDLVFGQAILHHLTWDLGSVYSGIRHLLRPGGRAALSEPFCGSPRLRRVREKMAWLVPLDQETVDERPLNDDDLRPLSDLFPEIMVERFDCVAKFARRLFRSTRMERACFRFDRFLLQREAFGHLAGGVFIAARK